MRVLMVLVALIATPAFAAVAQNGGQAAAAVAADGKCVMADEHRSPTSWENSGRPDDRKDRARVGCAPVAPAAACGVAASPSGTSSISGRVQRGVSPFDGLPGWCIEVTGAASGSAVTIADGTYILSSVPAGQYVACLVMLPGWTQTMPKSGPLCPSGNYGKSFPVFPGTNSGFINFRVVPAQ